MYMSKEGKLRQAELRKRRKEQGFSEVTVWVSKTTKHKINKLMKDAKITQSEAVERLITKNH